jgi:hypothetical protein
MSDLDQITTALERLFHEEGHRIVSWNDPDGEFQTNVWILDINGVSKSIAKLTEFLEVARER